MDFRRLRRIAPALACAALATVPALTAAEQAASKPSGVEGTLVTIDATVVAVDQATRRVTLKDQEGNEVEIEVGPEVRNLPQVEPGDHVSAELFRGMAFQVEPAGSGKPMRVEHVRGERAALGMKPGADVVREIELTARVEAVKPAERLVTLRGPTATVTVEVAEDVDLQSVKVGDMVKARFVETMAVSVTEK